MTTASAIPNFAERVQQGRERILTELRRVIVGQDDVVDQVLIALFTGGHCLITGVPGLAKTLLIKTIAGILDLDFKRIQFTPDLMPSDVTGTNVLVMDAAGGSTGRFDLHRGPIFGQVVLAETKRVSFGGGTDAFWLDHQSTLRAPNVAVTAFRERRLDHIEFPYLFLDATYVKAHDGAHVVSKAVIVATGVAADGNRENRDEHLLLCRHILMAAPCRACVRSRSPQLPIRSRPDLGFKKRRATLTMRRRKFALVAIFALNFSVT